VTGGFTLIEKLEGKMREREGERREVTIAMTFNGFL